MKSNFKYAFLLISTMASFSAFSNDTVDEMKQDAGQAWTDVKQGSVNAWDKVKSGSKNLWEDTKEGTGDAAEKGKEGASSLWNTIKEIVE